MSHRDRRLQMVRFTPTCVGKATGAGQTPRAMSGSPPRVWGRRVDLSAYATWTPVHPHVCGEGLFLTNADKDGIGSPPRVWGRR